MLACSNAECSRRFCEHCLFTHLQEDTDPTSSESWVVVGGKKLWQCPICRKRCCCSVTNCPATHRHCKAYRYRRRRAELASKRLTNPVGAGAASSRESLSCTTTTATTGTLAHGARSASEGLPDNASALAVGKRARKGGGGKAAKHGRHSPLPGALSPSPLDEDGGRMSDVIQGDAGETLETLGLAGGRADGGSQVCEGSGRAGAGGGAGGGSSGAGVKMRRSVKTDAKGKGMSSEKPERSDVGMEMLHELGMGMCVLAQSPGEAQASDLLIHAGISAG